MGVIFCQEKRQRGENTELPVPLRKEGVYTESAEYAEVTEKGARVDDRG
jgi:hypothetical protein